MFFVAIVEARKEFDVIYRTSQLAIRTLSTTDHFELALARTLAME
jgi:hypothetical protein